MVEIVLAQTLSIAATHSSQPCAVLGPSTTDLTGAIPARPSDWGMHQRDPMTMTECGDALRDERRAVAELEHPRCAVLLDQGGQDAFGLHGPFAADALQRQGLATVPFDHHQSPAPATLDRSVEPGAVDRPHGVDGECGSGASGAGRRPWICTAGSGAVGKAWARKRPDTARAARRSRVVAEPSAQAGHAQAALVAWCHGTARPALRDRDQDVAVLPRLFEPGVSPVVAGSTVSSSWARRITFSRSDSGSVTRTIDLPCPPRQGVRS